MPSFDWFEKDPDRKKGVLSTSPKVLRYIENILSNNELFDIEAGIQNKPKDEQSILNQLWELEKLYKDQATANLSEDELRELKRWVNQKCEELNGELQALRKNRGTTSISSELGNNTLNTDLDAPMGETYDI